MKSGDTVAPAATVTEAGSDATVLLLLRATTIPPVGAGPLSVTVLLAVLFPPVTVLGDRVRAPNLGEFTTSFAVLDTPLKTAEIVTVVWAVTGVVVMGNAGETIAPAGTVTEAGVAAAAASELLRSTTKPPVGAALPSVTVPLLDVPPMTLAGETDTLARAGGNTVSVALTLAPFELAVIVTAVEAATGKVVIVKAGDTVDPAATVTVDGVVAAAVFELLSCTTKPPAGAALERVTVPLLEVPPVTLAGDTVTLARPGGSTVSVAPTEAPLEDAVIVTGVDARTADVFIVKLDDAVAPAATVTEAGVTATAVLELLRPTTKPPDGAGVASVTVPLLDAPPVTLAGDTATLTSAGGKTVSVAPIVESFEDAVIVTGAEAATGVVAMVKSGDVVAPGGTVIDGCGDATEGFELESVTTSPPAGAGPPSVTVFPVVDVPPATLDGERVMAERPTGSTLSVALWAMPPAAAVMETEVVDATAVVAIVNGAEVAPEGTATDAGTVATAGFPV